MLRVLRVLQIQANRLWTCLEGEEEESEEEEEEDPQSIKAEASGAIGMEEEQVAVLRVLHTCFFVASRQGGGKNAIRIFSHFPHFFSHFLGRSLSVMFKRIHSSGIV